MTFRLPISVEQVYWRDGQKVTQSDVTVEQSYNTQTQAAIINNFFGSGLIPNVPERTFIFNSATLTAEQAILIAGNRFDGYGILPHGQPSDSSLGAQLEIELTGSDIFGRRSVSVLVIGLDFDGVLQYERFVFHRNDIQIGEKHFTRVLALMFNNFKGNANGSRTHGGIITIKEALPMHLSRWAVTSSQNVEPNLFFRDIKLHSLTLGPNVTVAIKQVISAAIGASYSVDSLGIKTTPYKYRYLSTNDITTRYAQKFISNSNNIQKITLLLGVTNDPVTGIDWSGDLVISLYALQSSVTCPSDIVPENAIDFLPDATPLAQLSINEVQLRERGIVLNPVEQPVDFVFSNTKIANALNSGIESGKYYMISIQRIGDASQGNIFTVTGNDRTDNSKFTFFNGVAWTDISTEDMWYEIWSDCFKVADGMGVDYGSGMIVNKTAIDSTSGATIDYCYNGISFTNSGQNQINYVVAQAVKEQFAPVQDQRTGNPVYSKQIYKTSASAISSATLTTLKGSSDPVLLGCGYDTNSKGSTSITGTLNYIRMGMGNKLYIVNPAAELLATNLIGCKIIPDINVSSFVYRIVDATLCSDGYGDVNGDGYIDSIDRDRAAELVGEGLSLVSTQTKIANGTLIGSAATNALEILRADVDGDGYVTANDVIEITEYIEKARTTFTAGRTFTVLVLTLENNIGRNDGYYDYSDTYIRLNPYTTNPPVLISSLTATQLNYYSYPNPAYIEDNTAFISSPYVPISYSITNENDYWAGDLVLVSNTGRLMPCTFTTLTGPSDPPPDPLLPGQTATMFDCQNRYGTASCPGGQNNFYVPGNLILGGQILKNSDQYFPIDYEVGNIIIELSELPHTDGTIDIFHLFIMDNGTGFTSAGYPAMSFADGTTVQSNAFNLNQLRFQVAIQSYSPNLDGYTSIDGYGIIIDPIIGVTILNTTGVLEYRATNLVADPTNSLLRTRLQISVQMKKAGWRNLPVSVTYTQAENITIDVP